MLDALKNYLYEYIQNDSQLVVLETDENQDIIDYNKGLFQYLDNSDSVVGHSITDFFILRLADDYTPDVTPVSISLYPVISNRNEIILKGLKYELPSKGYLYILESVGQVSEKSMNKMAHMNLELNNLTRDITKKNKLLKQKNQEIMDLVNLDPLTKLYNRRFLFNQFNEYIIEYEKQNLKHIILALADIDDFKHINDAYGHDLGDEALILFTDTLNRLTRESDMKVRYGGDEFIILFTDIDIATVYERIDSIVTQLSLISLGSKNLKLNATFGISAYEPGQSLQNLIKKSDLLLYEAKTNNKGHYIKSSSY